MNKKIKQKKKGKKGLILLCIILLCAVAVAVFFLIGQYSQGKKEYEAQIKKEAQELTDKLVSEIQTVDTSDQGLAQQITTLEPEQAPPELKTKAEQQVIEEQLAILKDERKQKVLQTLSVAYSKALDEQKQEAFQMVQNLIAQGKTDWAALVAKGENTAANKAKLASEYLAKSQVMEEQMDASFNALVTKMEEQLTAEGIDPTEIIAQYRSEYKKIKQENKSALMEKAMAAVKN